MAADDHVFDILGISHREDCYTSLLTFAINRNRVFRERVIQMLTGEREVASDWTCRARPAVSPGGGRKRDVPDIVFHSKESSSIIVVESKIFSGEGHGQTMRYASAELRKQLCNDLGMPQAKVLLYYLTLSGESPRSGEFQPIRYKALVDLLDVSPPKDTLTRLLGELRERVEQYEYWPMPESATIVHEYIRNTGRLVSQRRTFELLVSGLRLGHGLNFRLGVTGNPGNGEIPLCQWFCDSWQFLARASDPGRSTHFELQWQSGVGRLVLYLHDETFPYMTQEQIDMLGEGLRTLHANRRERLWRTLKSSEDVLQAVGWELRKKPLQMAVYRFDAPISYGHMQQKLKALVEAMIPVVEKGIG